MTRYIGLIDGEPGLYGIVFPDLPGCNAVAATIEAVISAGGDVMRAWYDAKAEAGESVEHPSTLEQLRRSRPDVAEALREGATAVLVPLVRFTGRSSKANLSIDDGILSAIDAEAARRKLTRSSFIEAMALEMLPKVAL